MPSSSAPARVAAKSSTCSRPAPLLRARSLGHCHGGILPEGPEAGSALRRLPQGRIWREGHVLGVPVVIGEKGVERVVKVRLNKDEQAMMAKSIASVQGLVDACKVINPR